MKPSDFLTELSNDKLTQYKTAAAADASKADKEGDFKKGDKRFSGIVKATKKQFDNDAKKDVAEGLSEPTRKVFFKVIKTQGTGMPSGYRRVKTMRPLEDGGFYIELSTPGYGMDYTRHNYKNFSLKDDQGKPITGHEANNIINGEQGVAEGSIGDKIKGAAKSVKRATQGWGIGAAPDMITPTGVVSAFKDMDGQRLANFVASRKEYPKPRKDSASAFADKVIDREMKQRGYGRVADKDEQGVAEGLDKQALQKELIIINKLIKDMKNSWQQQHLLQKKQELLKQLKQGVAEEKCPHCNGPMVSEELMNEKKDACYYKVKSRYKVWPSAYASGALVKCRKKGADSWGNGSKNESSILEGIEQADESLHDWFNKEKWVRMDTKGNIKGPCAKEPGEGKPKCLPQAKAHSLGKKGRASAAARKRREDPNPDRTGKAINVNTKKTKG